MSTAHTPTPTGTTPITGDRSLGELISEVTEDLSTLMRQEVELAKAEPQQSARRAGKAAGLFSGSAVAGHFALLFLSVALWWALGSRSDWDGPRCSSASSGPSRRPSSPPPAERP